MTAKTLVTKAPTQRLDTRIIGRCSRTLKHKYHFIGIGPQISYLTCKLTAVVVLFSDGPSVGLVSLLGSVADLGRFGRRQRQNVRVQFAFLHGLDDGANHIQQFVFRANINRGFAFFLFHGFQPYLDFKVVVFIGFVTKVGRLFLKSVVLARFLDTRTPYEGFKI